MYTIKTKYFLLQLLYTCFKILEVYIFQSNNQPFLLVQLKLVLTKHENTYLL